MTDDRDKEPDKEPAGDEAPKKRWWTTLLGRRSGDPAAGSITENEWTWLGDDATAIEPNRRPSRRGPKIAGILACSALVAGVIAFAATSTGNSGDAQVSVLASPTATSNATVEPPATAKRTPAPTPARLTPLAAPTSIPTSRFGTGVTMDGLIGTGY